MKTEFNNLLVIQKKVDDVISERNEYKPLPEQIYFAMLVEFFEFINKVGLWKWWKQNHIIERAEVLDEVADIIAFFLSYFNSIGGNLEVFDENIEEVLRQYQEFSIVNITRNIAMSIENGIPQPPEAIMVAALHVAKEELDATWEEIEEAYAKKSGVNVQRQVNNY